MLLPVVVHPCPIVPKLKSASPVGAGGSVASAWGVMLTGPIDALAPRRFTAETCTS